MKRVAGKGLMLGLGPLWEMPDLKNLTLSDRALQSSTQVEAPLSSRSPPCIRTPGAALQLPRARGQSPPSRL